MLKKCYVAVIGDDEGKRIGTVVVRGWCWMNPKWFFDKTGDAISGGNIIDFKRLR